MMLLRTHAAADEHQTHLERSLPQMACMQNVQHSVLRMQTRAQKYMQHSERR